MDYYENQIKFLKSRHNMFKLKARNSWGIQGVIKILNQGAKPRPMTLHET